MTKLGVCTLFTPSKVMSFNIYETLVIVSKEINLKIVL